MFGGPLFVLPVKDVSHTVCANDRSATGLDSIVNDTYID